MPYRSRAQQRWAHTPSGTKALGGPGKVKEWDDATDYWRLPALSPGDMTRKFAEDNQHHSGKRGRRARRTLSAMSQR